MNHNELCSLTVRWLKRPQSAGGHGCHIAVSEVRTGLSGEIPDAIGFRACDHFDAGSIVVEAKTSRADFLADRKKQHRQAERGCGNWRYFICPEGVVSPEELPQGWGLLLVNKRQHIKPVIGAAAHFSGRYDVMREQLAVWRQPSDITREQWLLVKLLARVGDPEEVNRRIKIAVGEQARLLNRVNAQDAQIRELRAKLFVAQRGETKPALLRKS